MAADKSTLGFPFSSDPMRAAFERRSLAAVKRIASSASSDSLAAALAASTDVGTLARALADAEAAGPAIVELEPLAPLIARNAEHKAALLAAAGGTLSAAEVGTVLGISRQAVEKRRQGQRLLAVRQGGDWRYPRCQFDDGTHEIVAALPRLLACFADSNPWMTLDFLLATDESLDGRTPLDVLRWPGWTEPLARLVRIERGDGFA